MFGEIEIGGYFTEPGRPLRILKKMGEKYAKYAICKAEEHEINPSCCCSMMEESIFFMPFFSTIEYNKTEENIIVKETD